MRILRAAALAVVLTLGTFADVEKLDISRLTDTPILGAASIAAASSVFPYTYNPSWFRTDKKPRGCLLVRVQNVTSATNPSPGPSSLAVSCVPDGDNVNELLKYEPITENSVVFGPGTPQEVRGTEDPRVRQVGDTYYMFYTAVAIAPNGDWIARLSLATTKDPLNATAWTRHGALFPDVNNFQFTKSAALLVDEDVPNSPAYLIFGDCTLYQGLQVARASADLLSYTVIEDLLIIEKRPNMFDSYLVESGPPPLKLDDGNWLFLYNGAQPLNGVPNGLFYSPGYVILNGSDPLQVLQRAGKPIIMPQHDWETQGLTPFVVFVEAMRYVNATQTRNELVAYYGAADTSIGVLHIVVSAASSASSTADEPKYHVRARHVRH
jgi:predicted GH43/DUF377 family glycosyl hydrolase